MTLEPLILKMISYDHGCPGRIQHFLKVYSFAKTIAVSEHLDEKTLFITEAAAIVHDIGIRLCLEKYGAMGVPFPLADTPEMDAAALCRLEDAVRRELPDLA